MRFYGLPKHDLEHLKSLFLEHYRTVWKSEGMPYVFPSSGCAEKAWVENGLLSLEHVDKVKDLLFPFFVRQPAFTMLHLINDVNEYYMEEEGWDEIRSFDMTLGEKSVYLCFAYAFVMDHCFEDEDYKLAIVAECPGCPKKQKVEEPDEESDEESDEDSDQECESPEYMRRSVGLR